MDIKSYLNAIGSATAKTASTVYGYVGGFSKTTLEKCSSVAGRVGEVAKRFIPGFISNTVQAHPKSFCAVAGIAAGLGIAVVASRFFAKDNGRAAQD